MNLDINNSLENNNISLDDNSFKQKLNEALELGNISVYECYDEYRIFSEKNIDKINQKLDNLILEYANKDFIENTVDGKIYELTNISGDKVSLREYPSDYVWVSTNRDELPLNLKPKMFFRKSGDTYILDVKATEGIFKDLEKYKNELYEKQQKEINYLKQDGNKFVVVDFSDDCEAYRTKLMELGTGTIFQDVEFPHDLFHKITAGSILKYENEKYNLVKGTSRFELSPELHEYCEVEDKYVAYNKFLEKNEYYRYLNLEKSIKKISKTCTDIYEDIKGSFKKLTSKIR